jgi:hypothetical protein
MAKQGGIELAKKVVSGSFTATGQSPHFPTQNGKVFSIALTGTAVGSVQLEKSFDEGATWCQLYAGGVQLKQWSYTGTNIAETYEESEAGVLYRLNCTSYTSGTLTYRLSQ